MKTQEILLLFEYHHWATAQILAAAAELTPAEYGKAADPTGETLHDTLTHLVDAELSWRLLLQHGQLCFGESRFVALGSLRARWEEEAAAMRAYLGSLGDQEMEETLRYTVDGGVVRVRVRWHCLVHLVNHGTQHRSEAAAMLTTLGRSPGDLDFTLFLNQRQR